MPNPHPPTPDVEPPEKAMTAPGSPGRHDGPRCGARKRQGEGTCTQTAGWGTDHVGFGACKLHGGSTGTQVVAAERQRVETEARRLLADLGQAEPVTDPLAALMQLAGEQLALKDAARTLVEGLDDIRYESRTGGEQLRAEVTLYERSLDRSARILAELLRLGVEERHVRLAEAQGALVVAAIVGAMQDIGMGAEETERMRAAVAVRLRALPAGVEASRGR